MHKLYALFLLSILCTGCSDKRTPPAQILNSGADVPTAALPGNPLAWQVVTSGVNRQRHTMFTLYGDDRAVAHARAYQPGDYPAGAQLALVTWSQKEDPHWFGANIPSAPLSVEYVTLPATPSASPAYALYQGPSLQTTTAAPLTQQERSQYILGLKAALMP